MANWNDILNEINSTNHLDNVRRKYLKELSDYTGRNTIAYYSAFLERQVTNVDINDSDMNGFMNAVHGLDYSKGLDLILHTPVVIQPQRNQLYLICVLFFTIISGLSFLTWQCLLAL